jgi:hypothetical protein
VNARALLAELEASGVRLTLAGDGLRCRTRPGVSIAPFRERIAAHRPALLATLGGMIPATKPPPEWDGFICAGCQWSALCTVLGPRGPHLVDGPCPAWPTEAEGGPT